MFVAVVSQTGLITSQSDTYVIKCCNATHVENKELS